MRGGFARRPHRLALRATSPVSGRLTVAPLPGGEWGLRADGNPHAQAPSVPIRRAGRRARDKVRVLLYALGGEKSVIGGIHDPSVAPHLNRKFVREVRSEFLWTVARASRRSNRRFAHFFFGTFFFCVKKKVHCPPCKGRLCAEGSLCVDGIYFKIF